MISRFEFKDGFKRNPMATTMLGLGVVCAGISIYAAHAEYSSADSQLAQAKGYSNGDYQTGMSSLPSSVVSDQPSTMDKDEATFLNQQASGEYFSARLAEGLAIAFALGDIAGATAVTIFGARDRALAVSAGAYLQQVYGASPDAPRDMVPPYGQ